MLHYTEYALRQCPGTNVAVYDGRLSARDRRRLADFAFERMEKSAKPLSVAHVTFVGRFSFVEKRGLREFHPNEIVELR